MKGIAHQFADLTSKLEDLHAIAVEGQRADNSPDMQRALVSHLRLSIAAMDGIVVQINHRLGDAHD